MAAAVEVKDAEAPKVQGQAPVSSASIAPNVILSIVDHHARRGEKQSRVIGGLYGILRSDMVEIKHIVPILHVEVEGENATLELGGWQKLQQLGRKINLPPLIGWYATGSQPGDMAVDQIFSMRTATYVRLLLDGDLEHGGLRVRVLGSTHTLLGGASVKVYRQIPFDYAPSNAVEAFLLQKVTGDLFPELQVLNTSGEGTVFERLDSEIDEAIKLVRDGKISPEAAFELKKALETMPKASPDQIRQMLTNSLQDASALKFLVKSISMILRVADKVIN